MAEESTNPLGGVETSVPTTEADAVASITERLRGKSEDQAQKPKEAGKKSPPPDVQADDDKGESEPGDDVKSDPKADDGKTDGDDGVEFPDTLEGLAEKHGVDAAELAGHIKLSVKQPDGTFKEISIAELRDNHLFQSDYTRKTQELAREKEAFTSHVGQQSQQIQQRFSQLDTLMTVLAQQIEQGPSDAELNRLAVEDPAQYVQAKHKRDQQMQAFRQAWEVRAQKEGQENQEKAQERTKKRAEQQKLLSQHMPELSKPEEAQKFEREMTSTLQTAGYSDTEISAFINGAFDHRQVLIVRDAMKFRAGQKAGEATLKKIKGVPKVSTPGASVGKKEAEGSKLDEQRRRLRSPRIRSDRKASEAAGLDLVKTLLRG